MSISPLDPGGSEVPGAAVITKIVRLLQSVADEDGRTKLAALVRATGYPRPTVHRLVSALIAEGMLAQDLDDGAISLGPRFLSLAFRAWDGLDLRRVALPFLAKLRDETEETVHLAVPNGPEMVYIEKLESRQAVRMTSRIGTRVLLHSSSVGKAYLASLPPAELARVLQSQPLVARTSHTITELHSVRADIAVTRERGYATDLQENELEICCLGAAILGGEGRPLGCISVSMPRYRFEAIGHHGIAASLVGCTQKIGQAALGVTAE